MDFTVLLDSPSQPTNELQIAKLGKFKDGRYGDFAITEDDVQEWARNLSKLPGGQALIDFDHLSDRPGPHRRTEAAGWITGVKLAEGVPKATVEWTPAGKSAIEEGRYRFFSPAYGVHRDEEGTLHKNVLSGGALTNKPFLGSMPQITLASAENVAALVAEDPINALYLLDADGDVDSKVTQAIATAKAAIAKAIALQKGDTDRPIDATIMKGLLGIETALQRVDTAQAKDNRTLDSAAELRLLDVTAAEREKAKAENNSLPDGSYPINNAKQLKDAATLAASKHGDWKAAQTLIRRRAKDLGVALNTLDGFAGKQLDSRPAMELSADILATLGIDDETEQKKILDLASEDTPDEKQVLAAIEAAKPAPTSTETRTLEQQASDAGKIVLDAAAYDSLTAGAKDGVEAKKQLDEQTFDMAFSKALDAGKAVAGDRGFYEELPLETAVKRLETAPQIINTRARGGNVSTDDLDPPSGVDPRAFQLDQEVRKHMLEKDMKPEEYPVALHAVEAKLGVTV
jgi:Mu-like prophage I protein